MHIVSILVTMDRVLDWWSNLLDSLIQRVTVVYDTTRDYSLHFTVINTHRCPQSCLHCRCLVAVFNGERSSSFGFPNYPQPQLPASNSNGSQRLNLNSSLTHSRSQSYVTTDGQSVIMCSFQAPILGPGLDLYYCQLRVCWFGRPLWREDGSIFNSCYRPSP
jgi:hypothetical protein